MITNARVTHWSKEEVIMSHKEPENNAWIETTDYKVDELRTSKEEK